MSLMRVVVAACGLVALFATATARAQEPVRDPNEGAKIVAIEVVGNTKTDEETVLVLADVETGDTFTRALADRVRADLVTSGLFKEVAVAAAPPVKPGPGVRLVITARDKHSWVIAPTFYNQPGNRGVGIGFGENNLFGRNKKLLVYGQLATSDSLFIAGYLDPSIAGSRWFYFRGDVFLRREEVTEYTFPDEFLDEPVAERLSTMNYLNAGLLLGVRLGRSLSLDGRLRGALVSFEDAHCAEKFAGGVDCALAPGADGTDVSWEAQASFDRRSNWYGVVTGNLLRLSYERGAPGLGSDFDYWLAGVRAQHARKFFSRHNLVWKGGVDVGYHLPFQQEQTSGGTGLRGYRNRHFRGDFKIAGSVEYSLPIFTVGPLALRGLAFTDVAYTTFLSLADENLQRSYLDGQLDDSFTQLRAGIGGGIRVYVKSIVLPLLGVDVGYAPQTGERRIYFAVGLTEL